MCAGALGLCVEARDVLSNLMVSSVVYRLEKWLKCVDTVAPGTLGLHLYSKP